LGDIRKSPQKNKFQAMRNTKKYITSAKIVNDSTGENSISYFKKLMKVKMISWTIYMIMDY
jgi:hypothetical protein